ncbi:hypothetical protein ACQ7HM_10395 [Williamsia sp. MIQD14]|uniref:hypothetical protein n=1 Tax=Williamsia sp. MIQD14 TaxID=3425703 RepID=UPI003DA06986
MTDALESELRATTGAISAEPLARIMFGSRELFHSNLIGWFCETMPAQATAVFDSLLRRDGHPDIGRSAKVVVHREKGHKDLVMEWPAGERRPVVIENKVFSLPDFGQLDRYAADLRNDPAMTGCDAVLLSLSDPKLPEGLYQSSGGKREAPIVWRHISYGTLGAAIDESVGSSGADYATETVRHYASLIQNLDRLAGLLEVGPGGNEPVHTNSILSAATNDPQLVSALSKLRARNVVTHIERMLDEAQFGRASGTGFSNGSPLIEMSYALGKTKRATRLGWQLQGDQLRLCAVLPTLAGRTALTRERRELWGSTNQSAFDFGPYEEVFDRGPLEAFPLKKPFNRFDPDFIYRYVDAKGITVSQLTEFARRRQRQIDQVAPAIVTAPNEVVGDERGV